jgi:prophage regulatory protein
MSRAPREAVKPAARFYSTRYVLDVTTLSRTSLWKLTKAGRFPAPVRLTPGKAAYPADAVDAWLAARQASPRWSAEDLAAWRDRFPPTGIAARQTQQTPRDEGRDVSVRHLSRPRDKARERSR